MFLSGAMYKSILELSLNSSNFSATLKREGVTFDKMVMRSALC
jgi:hypothetical protein